MFFFLELILTVKLWVHLSSLLAWSPPFSPLFLHSLSSDIVHPSLTGLFSRDLISTWVDYIFMTLFSFSLNFHWPPHQKISMISYCLHLTPKAYLSIGFLDSCWCFCSSYYGFNTDGPSTLCNKPRAELMKARFLQQLRASASVLV